MLGAVYAAGEVATSVRPAVMATLRRAIRWEGPIGADLIASLAGFSKGQSFSAFAFEHPREWALAILGFHDRARRADVTPGNGSAKTTAEAGAPRKPPVRGSAANGTARRAAARGDGSSDLPSSKEVRSRFRELLMDAHPDHGATTSGAAQRIADLTEARRILLRRQQ